MSVVTIQLGQCGNQIGFDLFKLIAFDASLTSRKSGLLVTSNDDYQDEVVERFFEESDNKNQKADLTARAVLVDTEPKVINQCILGSEKYGGWSFSRNNTFHKKQGSGNNWAQGYERYGKEVAHEIIDLTRKEVEKCDLLGGFLVIMSLAGGTGSGLGTYFTHCLKDEFEDSCVVNNVIWPYSSGEVILQNYNTVLSLAHLYESSDAIIVMQNDNLNKICTKLMNLKNVSFDDINKVISHKIASALQPAFSGTSLRRSNILQDLISGLCPFPGCKLLSLKNIPQISEKSIEYTTFVWPAMLKHLRQMLVADAAMEEGIDWNVRVPSFTKVKQKIDRLLFNQSLANALILRGKDCSDARVEDFQHKSLYASWIPKDEASSVWYQEKAFSKYEKSATLISNSQGFVKPINSVIQKAWDMFASHAYVHQYEKYGINDDNFIDSFGCLEQIVSDYQNL
ncbi:tubulin delta chain-like [Rhopilema esculentum]|uniref:tubulin delta chain-like n=1 Tax=Rhopilema esculentum TaxID=499914 RepID=UPI0031D1FB2E